VLTLADLAKAYGPHTLFEDVTLNLQRQERLGFVGPNGAGKSTLFRILLGEEEPDAGEVSWERGTRLGYLPQESMEVGEATILEIAVGHATSLDEHSSEHLAELDYSREPRAKKILGGLGFREADHHRAAKTFSGGWMMRAHLARLLVDEPDLLLLDEPTNHLDLSALLWFQEHLQRYPGGLIVISHDRAFLNAICSGILELRRERLFRWTGNYDDYLRQKEDHEAQQATLHKKQEREIARVQRFVDRFGAKASLASRAKSKEKQVERLKAQAVDAPVGDGPRVGRFNFPQPDRTGHKVITLRGVKQAYGDLVVYQHLDYEVERGEKQVLIGPNGAGKSTLLKILAGILPLAAGTREPGLRARVGYFAQNRLENLDPRHSVLEEALRARADNPGVTEQMARDLLGAFLFRGDDAVRKPVGVLSGGEKTRLALVKLLLAPPNLLLMDEPTTHLDIPSIDALIHALQAYEGTLVFISHDVHFIRAVAKKVIHVESGRLTAYAGGYDYYLEKSGASDARAALVASTGNAASPDRGEAPAAASPNPGYKSREQRRAEAEARAQRAHLRKEVADLEHEIAHLEARQAELNELLGDGAVYADTARARRLHDELAQVSPNSKPRPSPGSARRSKWRG
jgi:ATP-binding cassette, subfamily F, member 3